MFSPKSINPRKRIRHRFLLGAAIVLVVFLSLSWQPALNGSSSKAAPQSKHKYIITLTVSNDSTFKETMGQQFYGEIKNNDNTKGLTVSVSPKSWNDDQVCKRELACDRIAINTEKRTLIFVCNHNPYNEQAGPPCTASADLFRQKCIETLPRQLTKKLWDHSKAFHEGEDQ